MCVHLPAFSGHSGTVRWSFHHSQKIPLQVQNPLLMTGCSPEMLDFCAEWDLSTTEVSFSPALEQPNQEPFTGYAQCPLPELCVLGAFIARASLCPPWVSRKLRMVTHLCLQSSIIHGYGSCRKTKCMAVLTAEVCFRKEKRCLGAGSDAFWQSRSLRRAQDARGP